MTCHFTTAWQGHCKLTPLNGDYCQYHARSRCCSCGQQATHECDETGPFVCGATLCDDCEHTIFPDGTNGGIGFNSQTPPEGMKTHCKKTEQQYTPWYERCGERIEIENGETVTPCHLPHGHSGKHEGTCLGSTFLWTNDCTKNLHEH